MKTLYLWSYIIGSLIFAMLFIKSSIIYELFDSRPQLFYIWKSGYSISDNFYLQWTLLKERIKQNKINIKICEIETSKEPDLAIYEQSKQNYTGIPLVRMITAKGNRYDYNILDNYKYYYSATVDDLRDYLKSGITTNDRNTRGDLSSYLAANRIYKMVVDKYNK